MSEHWNSWSSSYSRKRPSSMDERNKGKTRMASLTTRADLEFQVAMTKTAKVSQGKATFNETLSLISTLYRDPKACLPCSYGRHSVLTQEQTGAFDEKNYKLAVKEVTKKGVAGKTLGGIALDLGAFGGTAGSELEKSLEFKIPGGDSNGVMDVRPSVPTFFAYAYFRQVVIKSSWLQNYRSG